MVGFSESDMRKYFSEVIALYCEKNYIDEEFSNMKSYYNGYKFDDSESEQRVYSPFSVLNHLGKMLQKCLDRNKKKNADNFGNPSKYLLS